MGPLAIPKSGYWWGPWKKISDRVEHNVAPSKFDCGQFLSPLTLTLRRLRIITFIVNKIMTWDFCRPKIQHCRPPKVYIWWPWGDGFSAPHTTKVGILLKIAFFSFYPLRRGRSHFSNFKHLFDVEELIRLKFLYFCLIRLWWTVWPIFAAKGVIFSDYFRFQGFNGHLGGKGVVFSSWC